MLPVQRDEIQQGFEDRVPQSPVSLQGLQAMLMGRDGALAPSGFEVPQGDYAWSKEEEDNGRDVKVESADGELEVESDDGELKTYFFI